MENQPEFSPDGRWLAYISRKSGAFEVYVTAFPEPGREYIISAAGGMWPRWRRDGRELFYLTDDNTLTAVEVNGDDATFRVGGAHALFQLRPRPQIRLDAFPYDVSGDGQRIIANVFVEQVAWTPITLFLNWTQTLKSH